LAAVHRFRREHRGRSLGCAFGPSRPSRAWAIRRGTDGGGCALTGAWSTHWYDGRIYESNIGEGLNVFDLQGKETATAIKLRHLNPQTQEFSLPR
jgi:hypothetical protein